MKAMLCATTRRTPAAFAAAMRLRVPSIRSREFLSRTHGHLRGIAHVRQIGQLMDHDIGLRRDHRPLQRRRRRTHRPPPPRAPSASIIGHLGLRPRRAGHRMAGVAQQLEQRPADHAARAGDEDIHR